MIISLTYIGSFIQCYGRLSSLLFWLKHRHLLSWDQDARRKLQERIFQKIMRGLKGSRDNFCALRLIKRTRFRTTGHVILEVFLVVFFYTNALLTKYNTTTCNQISEQIYYDQCHIAFCMSYFCILNQITVGLCL